MNSCNTINSEKEVIDLPDSTLINEVISEVIKTDSLWKGHSINKNIRTLKLYEKIKWENDSVPPPPPLAGPFSISYDELFSFFNSETNSNLRQKDSLYINNQINSERSFGVSESNIYCFNLKDDSYYQFYLPIFSSDKNVVYVFYALECGPMCGSFREIVLRRENNNWIKIYGDFRGGR